MGIHCSSRRRKPPSDSPLLSETSSLSGSTTCKFVIYLRATTYVVNFNIRHVNNFTLIFKYYSGIRIQLDSREIIIFRTFRPPTTVLFMTVWNCFKQIKGYTAGWPGRWEEMGSGHVCWEITSLSVWHHYTNSLPPTDIYLYVKMHYPFSTNGSSGNFVII